MHVHILIWTKSYKYRYCNTRKCLRYPRKRNELTFFLYTFTFMHRFLTWKCFFFTICHAYQGICLPRYIYTCWHVNGNVKQIVYIWRIRHGNLCTISFDFNGILWGLNNSIRNMWYDATNVTFATVAGHVHKLF